MANRSSRARCKYVGASSSRCGAPVYLANAIRFPRGGCIPEYCNLHQKAALSTKNFAFNGRTGTRTMPFKRFVSSTLERRTQLALQYSMVQPILRSDRAGYIYALELADPAKPDLIRIKVGRSVDVRSRLSQHRKRCPSSKPKLLGHFPIPAPPLPVARVRFCDRLERLVHTEIAELSAKSYPPGRSAVLRPCVDCHTRHTEIFVFKRLQGKYYGKEWSMIIRPVIEKWALFVNRM